MTDEIDLLAAADSAAALAYAPYSKFDVGAAVRTSDGRVLTGVNVENAAYPLGICAERAAIARAVGEGCRPGDLEAIAITASPCGGCRQRLREFMPLDATVHLIAERGARASMTLEELLPRSFGPEYLP